MKVVLFGPTKRLGAWVDERIIDLDHAFASLNESRRKTPGLVEDPRSITNTDRQSTLEAFIQLGERGLERAQRAIEHAISMDVDAMISHRRQDVRLAAPWTGRRIACVGGNFADHLIGMERSRGLGDQATLEEATTKARSAGHWGFWKVTHAVVAPDEEIMIPARTRYMDYEGEAAIVIGRGGKDIPADRLDEHVWGLTLVNDWSLRDSRDPPNALSYNVMKNFDGCVSMGPCIVAGELDCRNVQVETRVNGAVRQDFNTRDMIWSFAEVLEHLSRDFTFLPGDVICGGTAAGTAADRTPRPRDREWSHDLFLKPGDSVAVSSARIGTLANRLVAGKLKGDIVARSADR